MPLISALESQKQTDLCELEASMVYKASARTAGAAQRYPVSKNQRKKKRKKKNRKEKEISIVK